MQDIRCSSTPLCYECGQAAQPAQHPAGMNASMPGRIGDAFHAIFARLIYLEPDDATIDELIISESTAHAADATEVRFLTHWGLDHWGQIKENFPDPITEAALDAPLPGGKWRLTGHPDVISIQGDRANVLDYKTGRRPGDYLNQLRAYAYLIIYNDPAVMTVTVTQLDVRSSKVHTEVFSRDDIFRWSGYYAERLEDKQYRIGDHCGLCPRRGECPRISEWIAQMIKAFMGEDRPPLPEDKAEWGPILKKAYDHAGQLEYHLEDFYKGLKALLKATGPLPLPNGSSFGIVEKPRESIDASRAYRHVEATTKLPPEQILQGAKFTKKAIGELCRQIVPADLEEKAAKKSAWKIETQLLGELRAAGAVEENTSEYIEEIG